MSESGGGGGYSIPVSISDATAVNPTTTFTAGTVINFGAAANVRGDVMTTENTADLSPTATSSAAATGGQAASATDVGAKKGASASASYTTPLIIGVGLLVGYFLYKKFA